MFFINKNFIKKFLFFVFFFVILCGFTVYAFLKFFWLKSEFVSWEIITFTSVLTLFIFFLTYFLYCDYKNPYITSTQVNFEHLSKILDTQQTILIIFDPLKKEVIWTNQTNFFTNFFRIKRHYLLPLPNFLPAKIMQKINLDKEFKLLRVSFKKNNKTKEQFLISFLSGNMLLLQSEKTLFSLEQFFMKKKLIFLLLEIDAGEFILDPQNILEQQGPQIAAFIDLKLDTLLADYHSWLTTTKPGSFVILIDNEHFKIFKKNKFDFISKLTNDIYQEFQIKLTFSGGAYEGYDYVFDDKNKVNFYNFSINRGYQQSLRALKMSQSRLGDQVAVINGEEKIKFFGKQTGKGVLVSNIDKNYHTFLNLLAKYNNIFIVGHLNADFDVYGAGLGLKFLLEKHFLNKKKIYFVVQRAENETKNEVARIIKKYKEYKDIIHSNFSVWRKKDVKNYKNALILIDTNNPKIADISSSLIKKMKGIFIIDHHLDNFMINKPIFKLINTKFSSASEIITNFLQIQEQIKNPFLIPLVLLRMLLLGILIDTNNLQNNLGKQTIKCVNFLTQKGVNLSEIISQVNSYKKSFIAQKIESVFAQSGKVVLKVFDKIVNANMASILAEEYLLRKGVNVVFVVLFNEENVIYVSARSKKDFNVELVCQKLGGGGGVGRAAAKIINSKVDKIIDKIISFMDEK